MKVWTKKIHITRDIVIIELVRFLPLRTKREEALLKLSLSRAVEEDWGIKPQILLLGRLGANPEASWWIREIVVDLPDPQ